MTPRICFKYDAKHSANRNKQKNLIILQLYAQRLVIPCYWKAKRNSNCPGPNWLGVGLLQGETTRQKTDRIWFPSPIVGQLGVFEKHSIMKIKTYFDTARLPGL